MIIAGCDVGSLTGKAVIMKNGEIVSFSIVPVTIRPEKTAMNAMNEALGKAFLKLEEIEYLIGTGYGRAKIPFANENISEITCHGKGARWLLPSVRTIIDIGGQDCKAISLDAEGNVADFVMNDKCAAGTGRFLEVMAKALELDLDDLGPVSLKSSAPAVISSTCSVFAESEVITLMAEGVDVPDIVAGIHKAIAGRVASMAKRVGLKKDFTLTGGVAKNAGVVKFLEAELGEIKKLPVDPQIVGAIGAAIIAKERWSKHHA